MPDKAETISQMLQAQWTLGSPKVSDIDWAITRFDAADFQKTGKSYVVSCYNPGSPAQDEQLCREVYQVLEDVYIDIILKNAGTQTSINVRESMRQQVYDILHAQEFNFTGCSDVYPVREQNKVESPELFRLTIHVKCRYFHVKT
jgi:hypothetical protein